MEALSDELMLLVLGQVTDALTLLDSVPLVCRRWHGLSRDPRAWAGARLVVRVSLEGRVQRRQACALLHAPALRELSLLHGPPIDGGVRLESCLERCTATLSGLDLTCDRNDILGLLQRNRDHLRELLMNCKLPHYEGE